MFSLVSGVILELFSVLAVSQVAPGKRLDNCSMATPSPYRSSVEKILFLPGVDFAFTEHRAWARDSP